MEKVGFNGNINSKRICPRYLFQARIALGVDMALTIVKIPTR